MATLKVVLKKDRNADGSYPLKLRITKNRKTVFVPLGYNLFLEDWDEEHSKVRKSHPNSTRLNNLILKRLAEGTDNAIELETKDKKVSSRTVKQKLQPTLSGTFFTQADIYIDRLKKTNHNRWSADNPRVARMKTYFQNDLAFQDISVDKVKALKVHLKSEYKMVERTALNYLSVLRSIFRQAIDAGICTEADRPFGKKKVTIKYPDSSKAGLAQKDIEKLENVELTGRKNDARNFFLFSYYTAGTRVSDVFRMNWHDVRNGRLHYVMGKNGKGDSIKLPGRAQAILEQYKEENPTHNLIFPELKGLESLDNEPEVQKRIKTRNRGIDKLLKSIALDLKITDPLTMHISRHSFAQEAADKVPIGILQKLYRHANISTTANYQGKFTNKHTDDALDRVLGV